MSEVIGLSRQKSSPRGDAYPARDPQERATRMQARDHLARRVLAPGLSPGALAARIEDELDAMTFADRVMLEIDLRDDDEPTHTFDYEAGPWQMR
jgi:hypothetical protein